MDIEFGYLKTAILLFLVLVILGIPVFLIIRALWPVFKEQWYDLDKGELWRNNFFWGQFIKKNWGFGIAKGDIDGYPDIIFLFKFVRALDEKEQKELVNIFGDWYGRGSKKKDGVDSEFGGSMQWMADPKFKDKYAYFRLDMGTVNPEKAFIFLAEKLSKWNRGKISKVVFGYDEKIFNQFFFSS